MDFSRYFIILLLLIMICLLVYLIVKVSHLSQPVFSIDEEAARLIAERLANLTLKESNEYDAIKEALKQSSHIKDYYLEEIIECIKSSY